jgi:glycogen debranching enzyme
MGWKDAGDSVVYPDGTLVKEPKALCELQGYVFDAKRRLADAADYFDDPQPAARLRNEAAEMRCSPSRANSLGNSAERAAPAKRECPPAKPC